MSKEEVKKLKCEVERLTEAGKKLGTALDNLSVSTNKKLKRLKDTLTDCRYQFQSIREKPMSLDEVDNICIKMEEIILEVTT